MENTENVKPSKRSKSAGNAAWTELAFEWGAYAAQAALSGALFSLGGIAVNRYLGPTSSMSATGNEDVIQLPNRRGGTA